MEEPSNNSFFASKASIVGLFAVLTAVLTIPLVVVLTQQPQNLRGTASEPITTTPTKTPTSTREGMIVGYVYYDQNQNGQRNRNEKPFPEAIITIEKLKRNEVKTNNRESVPAEIKADTFGYFSYTFANSTPDSEEYIVKLKLPDGYKTITTNPTILSGLHKDMKQIIEFGLFPLTNIVPTTANPTAQPTCMPRPACLDATPSCKLPEPAQGWCTTTTPSLIPSQTEHVITGD